VFCLGRGLDGENLKKFEMARGQIRVLRRDQHLFRAGDEFDTLYVVRSGAIKTLETTDDGQERITGFYLPGQVLGLDGIENHQHRSTAVSLETSSVCPLPYRRLMTLSADIKGLQDQIWRAMSHEIANKQKLLLTLGTKDAEGRLATFLLAMSERLKGMGYSATEFRLSMGRHEIGEYLGLNLETVSRVFTRFHNAGLIERERRSVRLLDVPALLARSIGQGYVAAHRETPATVVPFDRRKIRAQTGPSRSRPAAA
jgi:CRP/FNR family transcriptional regulator